MHVSGMHRLRMNVKRHFIAITAKEVVCVRESVLRVQSVLISVSIHHHATSCKLAARICDLPLPVITGRAGLKISSDLI